MIKSIFFILSILLIFPVYAQEPLFDEQLVSSDEYKKTVNRLHELEQTKSYDFLLIIGTFLAVGAAFYGNKMTKNQLVTQNQILQKELDDKATWRILEILSDEKLRDARREIYTYRRNYDASNAPEEIRITTCYYNPNTAEQNLGLVKSKFGLIGEILKTDIHVSERVFDLYADTITLVWYAVEPEIKKYRVRHDDQRHMIHFEWLNEQSLKWYAVKKMSPPKFF